MNLKSGIFRLWWAGSLLWTMYWAERYLCLQGSIVLQFECGAFAGLFEYGLAGLGVVFTVWVARGFFSPLPHVPEVTIKRRAALPRVAGV